MPPPLPRAQRYWWGCALRSACREGLQTCILGPSVCIPHAFSLLTVLFALHPSLPSVEARTRGGQGKGGRRGGGKHFPFGLSLSSLSFLLFRVTFDAPRFPTSHSKHFLPGPLSCSGYKTQREFLQPDDDFVERRLGPPDPSPCPAAAGVRLPAKTLQFPPQLRCQPKVP